MKKILLNQSGATALEFAIVLPVLLLVIFALIEFSVIFYNKAMITNAGREGARAGIVYRHHYSPNSEENGRTIVSDDEIKEVITTYLDNKLINFGGIINDYTIEIPPRDLENIAEQNLDITIDYQHKYLILPNFANNLTGGLVLSAKSIMKME